MVPKKGLVRGIPIATIAILLLLPTGDAPAEQKAASPQYIVIDDERLALTNSSGGLIFEAMSLNGATFAVQIGRGGSSIDRSNTDLVVYDPFFSDVGKSTERAFRFDASKADLRIGSGNKTTSGDDGDIFLENGAGRATIQLDGAGTVNAELVLGATTQAGDMQLRNKADAATIDINGQSGNLTNARNGNGFVKAWARIAANGTVLSCFRCNTSASETRRLGAGLYEVDFTPVANNIRSRPRSATLDANAVTDTPSTGFVGLAHRGGDQSSVMVRTADANGDAADRAFILTIY